MSTPKDLLRYWLPQSKLHVFLTCFGIPFLGVLLFFGCGFTCVIASSDRIIEGNLHPFVTNPFLATWLVGAEFGSLVGFSTWTLVLVRNYKTATWCYVSLCYVAIGAYVVLSAEDLGQGFYTLIKSCIVMAVIFGPAVLFGYYLRNRRKIAPIPEPAVDSVLYEDEQVLRKCAARYRLKGCTIAGWLFVTPMRILFLESPMQNCGDFERTIWFDSVIQARPRFTLSYMPEEVLVETTNHKEEFEVEESWDLVELINERRLQQQDRNSPND